MRTEILTGYKRTEAGIIPDDWEVVHIGDIADIKNGATPSTGIAANWNGSIPWCTPTDVTNTPGKYLTGTARSITQQGLGTCGASLLPAGALLLCSRATIGEIRIASAPVCTNQGFKSLVCTDRVHGEFLYYLVLVLKPRLIRQAIGSTFLEVGKRALASIQVQVPPLKEQRTVAEVLSDVDRLIESLEALIAKKRAVKTAAMQRLLTGRTRLPAFRDTRWKAKKIGDLLTYERPDRYIVQHEDYVERGDVPVLTANRSFVLGYVNETLGVCIDFPVILFDDFTTDCKYVNFPFKVKSSAIKLLRAKKDVSLRYMCERMKMLYFPVVDHRRYYISDYRNVEIAVPAHDEQISIVAALSDMDAEIGALDGRLAKVRALKQGMMQQLLTGRIRLPASPRRSRRADRTVEEVGRSSQPAELGHPRSMEQNPSTPGR